MSVFNSLYANNYDSFYENKNYQSECDLIEKSFQQLGMKKEGTQVLDLGCGTGNHAIILSKRGFQVTGVDQSASMVEIASKKAKAQNVTNVEFLHSDIANFRSNTDYDGAVMMFAVLSYLTENKVLIESLKNVRRHLKKGAIFVCDFWYGPSVLTLRPTDRVKTFNHENEKVIRSVSTKLDTFKQTADVNINVLSIKNGADLKESSEVHTMRYFFPQELELIFDLAGFDLKKIGSFDSPERQPTDQDWSAMAIALAK